MTCIWAEKHLMASADLDASKRVVACITDNVAQKISRKHVRNSYQQRLWRAWLGDQFCDHIEAVFWPHPQHMRTLQAPWVKAAESFLGSMQDALMFPIVVTFHRVRKGRIDVRRELVLRSGALAVLSVGNPAHVTSCYFPGKSLSRSQLNLVHQAVLLRVRRYAIKKDNGLWLPHIADVFAFIDNGCRVEVDRVQFHTPVTWGFASSGLWQGPAAIAEGYAPVGQSQQKSTLVPRFSFPEVTYE